MRFVNDITLMSCQHNRLSPRCSIDSHGTCISCGDQPEASDTLHNTGNFEMTCVLRIDHTVDRMRGVIYK